MRLIVTLAFTLMATLAPAADVFEQSVAGSAERQEQLQRLSRQLREAAAGGVTGHFVQERFLALLDRPLRSAGTFSVSPEGAFEWYIREPMEALYHFREGVLFREKGGQRERIKPAADPMLYGFFSFFSRVFQLSPQALQELFEVYLERDGDAWQMGLIPRDRRLSESLLSITVSGTSARVSTVTVRESADDYSRIRFSY